jgi:hypothetical protein
MPLPRDQVAAYHRARRARLKTENALAGGINGRPIFTFRLPPNDLPRSPAARPLTARQIVNKRVAETLVDAAAIPRGALLKEHPRDLDVMWAKADAIGPGAVITKTNGRLDVITRADADARTPAPLTPPSPTLIRRSMVAMGGRPGRGLVPQGVGYGAPPDLAAVAPYTHAKQFEARTEAMLSALAVKVDEHAREIAALKAAAADRRADTVNVARAVVGLLRFGLTGL